VRCELRVPNAEHLLDFIRSNSSTNVATYESHKGQSVTIYGAGPSLSDVTEVPETDQYWACNSALPYLKRKGLPATHGFTIDQGVEMVREWEETFDVEYLLASSVNPKLTDHLKGRSVTFFHNWVGQEGEAELYRTLYPTSVCVSYGLNSVPRAVCLALAMGFSTIRVYGADCAARPDNPPIPAEGYDEWLKKLVLYADGRTAFECYGDTPFAEASLDGRLWHTRPDMVISARHLLDLERLYPGIVLIGDTLPNALRGITENLPQLTSTGYVEGFGIAA
jgi:hypothetical protein